jgi:ornithine--oxo-acid transaminase
MIGLELRPEAGGARQYCDKLKEKGLLCKDTHDHIIRFAPPLVVKKDEVNWALERINAVLSPDAGHSGDPMLGRCNALAQKA